MYRVISLVTIPLVVILCLTMSFCQKISDEEIGNADAIDKKNPISLSVSTRNQTDSSIVYPLHAYAFNNNGQMVAYQKIESMNDSIHFSLSKGTYTIVTIAGCKDEYVIKESPSINDVIKFKNESCKYAKESMAMGVSQVNVDKKDINITLSMSYCVSSFEVALHEIPSGAKKVEFSISPLYDAISYNGQYHKSDKGNEFKINCFLGIDGIWRAGPVYTFPGYDTNTTFKITVEKDSTISLYSHVHKGIPQASQPFVLNGTYSGEFSINGSVLRTEWEDATFIDFDFSTSSGEENSNEEGTGNSDPSTGTPNAGDLWNGCIVADVNGNNLLLLSTDEWGCYYKEAEGIVAKYSVNGITGWSLPSWEQATFLKKTYNGDKLNELNNKLRAAGKEIILSDPESRFLCYNKDGIICTFRFAENTNIVKPKSDETNIYYLRAIKIYSIR